jgi:hypothetical protein
MFFYCDYFVLNLFKNILKKVFKRTVMLSAALLMTSAMYAAVIGAGTDASGAGVNVVGCGDQPSSKLRRIDCGFTTPVYACGVEGTAEVCVESQACPQSN